MTTEDTHDRTDSETDETRELTVSRVIGASPDRVYEAFVNPDELAEWMHPHGFSAEVHHLEPEEGGTYRISMTGKAEGMEDYSHSYTGTFEELVPGERIVQTESPDGGGMTGEMTVTITFDEVPEGTEVNVRIEIPTEWPDEAIGGWEAALENLDSFLESV
jgi:uncharacterized protein YndB with AHSA1/START domain